VTLVLLLWWKCNLEVRLGPVVVILVAACIWRCKAAAFGGVT